MNDVVVKRSKISGKGVFAIRNFKKGEKVLVWHPKSMKPAELKKITVRQKPYLEKVGAHYFLMQPPEKFVNHSCEPNTRPKNKADIAIRDIKKGEEITSNYEGFGVSFKCRCGSESCRKFISLRTKTAS